MSLLRSTSPSALLLLAATALAAEPIERTLLVAASTTDGSDWVGRGRLAELPSGRWVYAYVRGRHHGTRFDGTKRIRLMFSDDEGRSWSAADTLPDGDAVAGFPFDDPAAKGFAEVELIPLDGDDLLLLGRGDRYREAAGGPPAGSSGQVRAISRDGGRTWSDAGYVPDSHRLRCALDYTRLGETVLVPFYAAWEEGRRAPIVLLASDHPAGSWSERSVLGPVEDEVGETGLIGFGEEGLLAICRTVREDRTLARRSDDGGRTWGDWIDLTAQVGVVQQPRLRRFATEPGRLYLFGRNRYEETTQRNAIWWSDDAGTTWTGFDLDEKDFVDTGYGDALPRDDGSLYYIAYRGRDGASDLYGYVIPREMLSTEE